MKTREMCREVAICWRVGIRRGWRCGGEGLRSGGAEEVWSSTGGGGGCGGMF